VPRTLCDLEKRRIADLLPDRDTNTVKAWLRAQPEIGVVARDRAGGFAGAVGDALPGGGRFRSPTGGI